MKMVRASWALVAMLAIAAFVWAAREPIAWLSLSCSKGWVLSEPSTRPGASCETSLFSALEPTQFAVLAALVIAPPLVAAACNRLWASAVVVAVLIAVIGFGLSRWSTYWLVVAMVGAPVAFFGLIITLLHLAIKARDQSLRGSAPGDHADDG